MLPPKPARAVFILRVNGKLERLRFGNFVEAQWAARDKAALGREVEIVDYITGETVERVSATA